MQLDRITCTYRKDVFGKAYIYVQNNLGFSLSIKIIYSAYLAYCTISNQVVW